MLLVFCVVTECAVSFQGCGKAEDSMGPDTGVLNTALVGIFVAKVLGVLVCAETMVDGGPGTNCWASRLFVHVPFDLLDLPTYRQSLGTSQVLA